MRLTETHCRYIGCHIVATCPISLRGDASLIKMTVHLLNSAMMPAADGIYRSFSISREEFAARAVSAHNKGELKSYIGYKQTAEILTDLCGFEVVENRQETVVEDGVLIARIKYRLSDGFKADAKPSLDDLEFRIVYYKAR